MKNNARFKIVSIVMIVIFLLACMCFGYFFGYKAVSESSGNSNGIHTTITVNEGDSISDVASRLYDEKIIEERMVFIFQYYFYSYSMTPGTYDLDDSMTYKEILTQLEGGGV